jgi:hypothetical protein
MTARTIFAALAVSASAVFVGCGTKTVNGGGSGGSWGSSDQAAGDAALTNGGNSLSGSLAFSVQSAQVTTAEAQSACGYQSVLPDGSYATIGVLLSDMNIQVAICGDAAAAELMALRASLAGHPLILIQMKTVGYPPSGNLADAGAVQPIGPGTYPVAFENLSDDDLCMAPKGQALIDLRNWSDAGGALTVASASMGTLTLTTVASGHIAGSFDVKMEPAALWPVRHSQYEPLDRSVRRDIVRRYAVAEQGVEGSFISTSPASKSSARRARSSA